MKRRQMMDITAAALLAIGTSGLVGADGTDTKTAALLGKLRQALGGEAKLAAVKGLSLEADMRRVMPGEANEPGPEMAGEISLDLADPSHYLFIDSFAPMAGMPLISIGSALDGDTPWTGPVSAPTAGIMLRTDAGSDPARLRARLQKDMTRLSVALLAGANIPGVEWSYAGPAESPEGKAEVLEVKGPGDFKGRLFLDEKTSRPMMLVYQEIPRRMAMRRSGPGAMAPGASAGHGASSSGAPDAAAAPPAPELKEAQMFFSDYKVEGGVSLPRAITIKVQDGPTEEWTVQKIKVNPTFAADHFKKR
jgi:hypothetical protein